MKKSLIIHVSYDVHRSLLMYIGPFSYIECEVSE